MGHHHMKLSPFSTPRSDLMRSFVETKSKQEFPEIYGRFLPGCPFNPELLREEIQKMAEQHVNAQLDEVTGLLRRHTWFEALNEHIENLLPDLKSFHLLNRQEQKRQADELVEAVKDVPLYTIAVDVSYLGKVNEDGHREGDRLLRSIAELALDNQPKAERAGQRILYCRSGGDEISLLSAFYSKEQLIEKIERWKKGVSEIHIPILAAAGLEPNLDIGVARIGAAAECFREVIEVSVDTEDNDLKAFVDVFFDIADFRAMFTKYSKRLKLLARLWKTQRRTYNEYIGALRKGANNASDRQIQRLVKLMDSNQEAFERAVALLALRSPDNGNIVRSFAARPFLPEN